MQSTSISEVFSMYCCSHKIISIQKSVPQIIRQPWGLKPIVQKGLAEFRYGRVQFPWNIIDILDPKLPANCLKNLSYLTHLIFSALFQLPSILGKCKYVEICITGQLSRATSDTDSHTKSTGNCGENKFSRANPKTEVKILTICLSNLATKNPEEKRFWKEEQSPRLRQKRVICGWKEASVSLLCIIKLFCICQTCSLTQLCDLHMQNSKLCYLHKLSLSIWSFFSTYCWSIRLKSSGNKSNWRLDYSIGYTLQINPTP